MATTVNTRTLGNYLQSLQASASPNVALVTQDLQVLATDFFLTGADISMVGQTGQYADLIGAPTIGSAAAQDVSYFALAASGALADTALQPADVGTAAYTDAGDYATASQGVKADTAVQEVQPGAKITVDNTDPLRPVIAFAGTAVGQVTAPADFTATGTPSATTFLRGDNVWAVPTGDAVESVGAGAGIDVDATDPNNPIVSIQSGYLATVATTGAYADLAGLPSLFSGVYADLTGKPALFSGAYADLTGKPTLGTAAATNSTAYATAAQGAKADSALQSAAIGSTIQAYSAVLQATTASYTTALNTKLNGIATGATANQTDTYLLSLRLLPVLAVI